MKQLSTIFSLLLLSFQVVLAQDNSEISIGSKVAIHSTILGENRTYLISLPDSYNDPANEDKKYPIIILLDGYTHFKTASGIVHFMSSNRIRNNFMPETIIIAIENVDRERDFTVTKLKTKRQNTMGGGRNFLDFIEKELIPYVDENYRTEPFRTLIGHSLGGLLTLNSYLDKNSLFDSYIAIDPSIWWDAEVMQNNIDSISTSSLNKRLYIATANQGEASYERNKKKHDDLYALITQKSNGQKTYVKLEYFDKENHRSVPLKALYEGLKYLNKEN